MVLPLFSGRFAILVAANSAIAATEEERTSAKEIDPELEVIEVRGFSRSLIQSLNQKRFSDTVSEQISADDLGALPDISMADALTRLPGISAVRTGGQAAQINIRGLSGGFVFSTLNGREQVSISDNRGVEFDLYPSEIMSGVTVYKTPDASIDGEGIDFGYTGGADTLPLEWKNAAGDIVASIKARYLDTIPQLVLNATNEIEFNSTNFDVNLSGAARFDMGTNLNIGAENVFIKSFYDDSTNYTTLQMGTQSDPFSIAQIVTQADGTGVGGSILFICAPQNAPQANTTYADQYTNYDLHKKIQIR